MCQTFIPIMRSTGRIVNVSSVASVLDPYSNEIQERFRTARNLQNLEDLIADYEVSKTDTMFHYHFLEKERTLKL